MIIKRDHGGVGEGLESWQPESGDVAEVGNAGHCRGDVSAGLKVAGVNVDRQVRTGVPAVGHRIARGLDTGRYGCLLIRGQRSSAGRCIGGVVDLAAGVDVAGADDDDQDRTDQDRREDEELD